VLTNIKAMMPYFQAQSGSLEKAKNQRIPIYSELFPHTRNHYSFAVSPQQTSIPLQNVPEAFLRV